MKTFTLYLRQLSLALFVILFPVFAIHAQTTTFTHHGRMTDGSDPSPTGQYDLQFNLYDEASGTNSPLSAIPVVLEDVQVISGMFSVSLDFGNLFNGADRYLEIGVRPASSTGAFTLLTPRQQIMSSPHAIRSLAAVVADPATNAQNLGGNPFDDFVLITDPRLTDARVPTAGSNNYIQNRSSAQSGANFNISGSGTAANLTANSTLSGSIVNATTQFNIGGNRVLSAGISNIFAGISAGAANTGGSNSFFGHAAGESNTTGSNNSFIGYQSGLNNTTGSNNTVIGTNANVGAGNLFFASAIGARASVSESDTIVLGKVAGTYDGVSRVADTVRIPGNLNVTGTISGNVSGVSLTSLNASNITSGTLDNARLGVIGVANGGTGLTSAGSSGNFLRSNGTSFTSSALTATDIPAGNTNYIQNTTTQQAASNFNVSGNGVVGGNLSVNGALNASGSGLTSLNASNITTGTLDNARLGAILTANIADSAVTAAKIGSNQVVKNLNGLTDNVNLAAGANVTITPSGNTLTISAAGGNFIQNTTAQQPGSNFNVSGNGTASNLTASSTLSGNIVNAATQFNIADNRVLTVAGTNNIFAGHDAGQSNTTGSQNSFFGRKAGNNNTGGSGNSFAGYAAGHSNASGDDNSFFGAFTGYNTTTGYTNAFFGARTGYSNTTGINNAFLGTLAGFSNVSGNSNAFIGTSAGYSNTSGSFNSTLGTNAGYNNTTGNFNVFFGTAAGFSNVSGHSNSFVGTDAGKGNMTGNDNSFVGYQAGHSNTAGSNNSFVGKHAGFNNTTGGNITIIGANANVVTNNLSYATAIGSDAIVSTSNTIVLGRSAGQDTVLTPGLLQLNTLGAAGSNHLCRNASNQIAACSSSLRYKTNIAPFTFGLNFVQRLRPITFTWKDGGLKDIGFGAEDIAAIEPLLVTYNAKGEVEGVKYDRISVLLINAAKEQQAQIEAQQAQIEAQQQQLRQQQTLIDGLKKLLCLQNPTADVCR